MEGSCRLRWPTRECARQINTWADNLRHENGDERGQPWRIRVAALYRSSLGLKVDRSTCASAHGTFLETFRLGSSKGIKFLHLKQECWIVVPGYCCMHAVEKVNDLKKGSVSVVGI